jgi:hypothetical protein
MLDVRASYARTALDDPGCLPEGELDEAIADAELYDRVFADAAPAPTVRYAIGQMDEIINVLNPDYETRETFAATLTVLGRHLADRLERMENCTLDAEGPDKTAYDAAAECLFSALDELDEAIAMLGVEQ